MKQLQIVQVAYDHTDLSLLIRQLDEYLLERYPADEVFGIDDPSQEDITFLVAYSGGRPAGCGAIREIDRDSTELKRFFVHQDYRNQGIAEAILLELEFKARNQGYKCIKLEAGEAQPEALNFYRKHGYYPIDRFGKYAECASSVCYEKQLG
jgi:GNAT superfamily N-acetyltransferase